MIIIELTPLDEGVVYVNGEHIAAIRTDPRNQDTILELCPVLSYGSRSSRRRSRVSWAMGLARVRP